MKRVFERLVEMFLKIYGHPVTFLLATILVGVFLVDKAFQRQELYEILRDIMYCITFLSFFLIQKAVNKYTTAIHIKINELVSAHEKARNELVNIEEKTEDELQEIAEDFKNKK